MKTNLIKTNPLKLFGAGATALAGLLVAVLVFQVVAQYHLLMAAIGDLHDTCGTALPVSHRPHP